MVRAMKQVETDITLPGWFTDLVDAIKEINLSAITDPIVEIYAGPEIPGWTVPPFQCMICGAKFAGDDAETNYAEHLALHITAFQESWFAEA